MVSEKRKAWLTPLVTQYLGKGRWRLTWMLKYQLRDDTATFPDGIIQVPAGFTTDFASVPRIPIVYAALARRGNRAAVVHDWLYFTGKVDRRTADRIFAEALEDDGERWWTVWTMWLGVRIGGWIVWRRYRRKPSGPEE